MKSIKNHLSLIVALLSILASIQIFIVTDRAISAYKNNLATNYSVIVVSHKTIKKDTFIAMDNIVLDSNEIAPDNVIKKINSKMDAKDVELIKLGLPKFYKIHLKYYPSPIEIEKLTKTLFENSSIYKVEDFSNIHDKTYKLLLLFKGVVSVFAVIILLVTVLLIFKELKIWQFKHSERMSIMGLFGAPIWLRSVVLFRLAIVDAIISSILTFVLLSYFSVHPWVLEQFRSIGIEVVIFDSFNDFIILFSVSVVVSILLASLIVLGHKEEL